jgi:ABC-type nitrate/sulfonate/bicarbonate transport system substrate-binding protein
MGHPDALAALLNPQHEVASHFASSPVQEIALKTPGIHVVLGSRAALGGDCHVSLAYATSKFYEENPKTVRAFLAAYEEAVAMIETDPKGSAQTHLAMVKERRYQAGGPGGGCTSALELYGKCEISASCHDPIVGPLNRIPHVNDARDA